MSAPLVCCHTKLILTALGESMVSFLFHHPSASTKSSPASAKDQSQQDPPTCIHGQIRIFNLNIEFNIFWIFMYWRVTFIRKRNTKRNRVQCAICTWCLSTCNRIIKSITPSKRSSMLSRDYNAYARPNWCF